MTARTALFYCGPAFSSTPGPERPDAAKGDQRSPDAMDQGFGGIRVVRFRANNADIMKVRCVNLYSIAADVAEIVEAAKIAALAMPSGLLGDCCLRPSAPRYRSGQADHLGLLRRPISVPGIPTPISAARALMDAMGRLSLTVMSVMLFPASDIVRRSPSSCSDHRSWRFLRVNIIAASQANEAGPRCKM